MKIHIFALRWRDEIKRSSQLRTLLKRVYIIYIYIYIFIYLNFDQLPVGLLTQLVERCTGIAEVMYPYGPEFFFSGPIYHYSFQ